MNLKQAATQPIQTLIKAGKALFPEQQSTFGDDLLGALNNITGMSFSSVGDFLGYYQEDYFQTAYTRLTPFVCHQLAISNTYVSSAINAIVKPIASAKIIAVPISPETIPVDWEIDYLNDLINHPNPKQTIHKLVKQLLLDQLQTGSAFIEVNYNDYGFPARLDRIAPYKVTPKKINGNTVYIRTDNGHIFPENGIIPLLEPNPYNEDMGLTPLVGLFTNILTDHALMEHNLRYFVKDTLKGIISVSDKIDDTAYSNELERMKQQIREMEDQGESGHLIMHGATFTALGNTNRDMMTPEILEANINAICATYHVPPHKVMKVESGNLGTGTGESQEDAMNETISNRGFDFITDINFKLCEFAGITNTKLEFKDLTKTDEVRETDVNAKKVESGAKTLNEIRVINGDEPYDDPAADQPLVDASKIPLNMIGLPYLQRQQPGVYDEVPQSSEMTKDGDMDEEEPVNQISVVQQRIDKYLRERGLVRFN